MSILKTNRVQSVTEHDLTLDTATTSKRVVIPETTGDDADLDGLSGRLVIGSPANGKHLAIDENEIMAKTTNTVSETLYLNKDGSVGALGGVAIGGDIFLRNGAPSGAGNTISTDDDHLTLDTTITTKYVNIASTTGNSVSLSDISGKFIVGNPGLSHLAFDADSIQAKSNGTTATTLHVNSLGGIVKIGGVLRIDENGGDVASGAAIPLTTHASAFVTGGSGETSTLAAGTEGQVKVLVMKTDGGGDMVVTVTNAGWKSSGTGTITFAAVGEGVTMQYIDSKWYVIGRGLGALLG